MLRSRLLLAAMLASFTLASTAGAAIQVIIEPTTIAVGDQATIDIKIVADPGTKLQGFSFRVDIGDPYGGDSQLEFVVSAPSYKSDSAYVFLGATTGPGGDTAGSVPAFVWVGGDFADLALPDFYVDLDGEYLLARLLLKHTFLFGGDPIASGQSLFPLTLDPGNTEFVDELGNEIARTLTNAVVEIVPASTAAIPEPATWLIFAGLAAALPWCRRRR